MDGGSLAGNDSSIASSSRRSSSARRSLGFFFAWSFISVAPRRLTESSRLSRRRILPSGIDPSRAEGDLLRGGRDSVADASDSGQSQIQIQPNPGLIQQSPAKLKHRKSLDFLRRIGPYQWVTPTPMAFFSFARRFRLKGGHGAAYTLLVRPCLSFFFLFISGSSGLSKQVKGWRHF